MRLDAGSHLEDHHLESYVRSVGQRVNVEALFLVTQVILQRGCTI